MNRGRKNVVHCSRPTKFSKKFAKLRQRTRCSCKRSKLVKEGRKGSRGRPPGRRSREELHCCREKHFVLCPAHKGGTCLPREQASRPTESGLGGAKTQTKKERRASDSGKWRKRSSRHQKGKEGGLPQKRNERKGMDGTLRARVSREKQKGGGGGQEGERTGRGEKRGKEWG